MDEFKFHRFNWDSCVIPFRREDWGLVVMIFNQALLEGFPMGWCGG